MKQNIKQMTVVAMMAAVMCVLAPFSIPIGVIPISLATFTVYCLAATFGWKRATPAVLVYLLLGAFGVPVFAGWVGGFQSLIGVTGGYLLGYLPCAFLVGFLTDRANGRVWMMPLSMLTGTAVLYALGTAWFCIQTDNSVGAAMAVCVVPFFGGDAVKILLATFISVILRSRLKTLLNS